MERERFTQGMRVRTVEPHLCTATLGPFAGKRVVYRGEVSHLSSEAVGAVWVRWDKPFLQSGCALRPVRPEMLCREDARPLRL